MTFVNMERPVWLARLVVSAATICTLMGVAGIASLGLTSDWLAFYHGGFALLQGQAARLYELALYTSWQTPITGDSIFPFLYAPAYAAMFVPLALFPVTIARLLWLLIALVSVLLALRMCRSWSGLTLTESVIVLLSFLPSVLALAVGQMSPLTLLIFTGVAVLEWRARTGFLPGLVAGLVLYKPQLLLPLVLLWLWKRRWRTLGGFGLSAGIVTLGSLLVSPSATWSYLFLGPRLTQLIMPNLEARGTNATLYTAAGATVSIVIAVLVLAVLLWNWRKPSSPYHHALLWLAPFLTTPYLGTYDLLLLWLPVSFLIPVLRGDRLLQAAVAALWLTPWLLLPMHTVSPVPWAVLFLFCTCAWRARAGSRHDESRSNVEMAEVQLA